MKRILFAICCIFCAQLLFAADNWTEMKAVLDNIHEPQFPDRTYNILSFHQEGDSLYTSAINRAIQQCNADGGGTVIVPKGEYETAPIRLLSNVNLHLEEGAVLRFSTDARLFPSVLTRIEGIDCYNISPLIYAYGAENIAITGKGVLDGQATAENWLHSARIKPNVEGAKASEKMILNGMLNRQDAVQERVFFGPAGYRPQFINLYQCKNILLEDFEINRSPFWLLHPLMSENITVRRVKMLSHNRNNDGCDPESCRNVLIEDCDFNTGDDCIAIKSGKDDDGRRWNLPCENIIVRNCRMMDGHAAVAMGSEITGGVRNVWVEDCQMSSPNLDRIIRIKSNPVRGGEVSNINVRNLQVGECKSAILGIELKYWRTNEGNYLPLFHDITLENITSQKSNYLIHVDGDEADKDQLHDITFSNCDFRGIISPEINHFKNIQRLTFYKVKANGKKL